MTFDVAKKRVGSNLLVYDATNSWKTNRDVTETDIGNFLNDLYRFDIFPMFANQYPEDFRQEQLVDSWIASGTGSGSSTGSTLVATTSIFTSAMVGLYVYNTTDSTSVKITSYTSATTVTTDGSSLSSWSGDSIFVLGQEFNLSSVTRLFTIENVGVKYSSSDTYYRDAFPREKFDFYQDGGEVGGQLVPEYYRTNLTVSSVDVDGFGLIPQMTAKLSSAIKVTYIAIPNELSATGDTFRLPNIDLALTYGATARGYEMKQQLKEAQYWQSKYEIEKDRALQRYSPASSDQPMAMRLPRKYGLMHKRLI